MNFANLADRKLVYLEALKIWGSKTQTLCAIEEMAELQQVLAKSINDKEWATHDMIDELADVRIMVEQMEALHGIEDGVQGRMQFKMERLKQIVDNGHRDYL